MKYIEKKGWQVSRVSIDAQSWANWKQHSTYIIGCLEGEKEHEKKFFERIMAKVFPNQKKSMKPYIQEIQ